MRRARARLSDERGWGLVSSVLVIGILLSLSLPLLSLVDSQQMHTARERKSESSFNLAEAALDAQMFVLGKNWPGDVNGAYPSECTPQSTDLDCASAQLLASSYSGGDFTDRDWTIQVRDDTRGEYYDPENLSPLTYDSNENGKVWVRADAHAAEGNRTVVALVKRIDSTINFPRNAITAGWFQSTNNGNKVIVDTKGNAAQAAPVAVRCPGRSPGCLQYRQGQVSPDTTTVGYPGETIVSPEILESFRAKAKALDTYYSSCPSSLTGEMVFIENGDCRYTGGGSANSAAVPGSVVIANGTLHLGGNVTFYGLVYAANLQRSTGEIVRTQGAATIVGAVAVDGDGGMSAGSNKLNVVFADGVFQSITSFTAAAPVQGSWRELPAS
jgi:type II secretory pathway pseudopilin PulG